MKRFYLQPEFGPNRKIGLFSDNGKLCVAQFLSPAEAKHRVLQRHRNEEIRLFNTLQTEAAQPERYPER